MTVSAEFDRAFRLHQEGKLREAFLRYDAIIQTDPLHAAALHFSGVVLHQAGKRAEAIARIRASIGIDPGSPDACRISRSHSKRSTGRKRRSMR